MTLIISSYNGREMDLSVSEPLFNLNIRLIQPVKHFKTLDSLRTYLVENIPVTFLFLVSLFLLAYSSFRHRWEWEQFNLMKLPLMKF